MEQILVQAAHACYEAGHHFHPAGSPHPNFVVIGVPDEEALLQEDLRIRAAGISTRIFIESDIGDQHTALATEIVSGATRRFFRSYKLLKLKGNS